MVTNVAFVNTADIFFLLPSSLLHLSSKQFLGYLSSQLKIAQTDIIVYLQRIDVHLKLNLDRNIGKAT